MIESIINSNKIPVYGDGKNIRDWLYVEDHVEAIIKIFHKSKLGETYCIGGNNEISNINLIYKIIEICDKLLGRKKNSSINLISFIEDRLGHDYRYAIDITKINNELNWNPKTKFIEGLTKTIKWYINESRNNI